MKIAIMQPYLFPYIGYFQLIKAVDIFVFYDDVNYIKQGWINRNKILTSSKEFVFTIPLKNSSSFNTIRETEVNTNLFIKWKSKFLQTVEQSYKKAPYFEKIYPLIIDVLNNNFTSIADFANDSIIKTSNYLGLKTKFICSSSDYPDTKSFDRENRLIEIIKRNNAVSYINPVGGKELYAKQSFALKGIELNFIKSRSVVYKQFENDFVPWLSIIDVLMFNNQTEINDMLEQYDLI
jgi:hypothetical protein